MLTPAAHPGLVLNAERGQHSVLPVKLPALCLCLSQTLMLPCTCAAWLQRRPHPGGGFFELAAHLCIPDGLRGALEQPVRHLGTATLPEDRPLPLPSKLLCLPAVDKGGPMSEASWIAATQAAQALLGRQANPGKRLACFLGTAIFFIHRVVPASIKIVRMAQTNVH